MDNQHKQIKGYRDLSQEEIDLMNKIKALAEEVGELVEEVETFEVRLYEGLSGDLGVTYAKIYGDFGTNLQWSESAKKDLQLGFMQLIRAVAKPQSF